MRDLDQILLGQIYSESSNDVESAAHRAGYTVKAYHGTREFKGNKFNRDYSVQGVFWFSEDLENIKSGQSGAAGFSKIIQVYLNPGKVAGWKEYEKLFLSQIKDMGFDSIKLDDDWIIFDPHRIKSAEPITYDDKKREIPLAKRFNIKIDDIRY